MSKIKTVGDLVAALQRLDQSARVVVDGGKSGFTWPRLRRAVAAMNDPDLEGWAFTELERGEMEPNEHELDRQEVVVVSRFVPQGDADGV